MKIRDWLRRLAPASGPAPRFTGKADELMRTGFAHHRAGEQARAQQCYLAILAEHPDHPDALYLLGEIACAAGRNDEAVDLITRAIRSDGTIAAFHYRLGVALQALGETEQARQSYEMAIVLAPDHAEAHNNLGSVLEAQGLLDQAMTAYRKAVDCNRHLAQAQYNLGIALCERGEVDEAVERLHNAVALQPDHARAHCSLGHALRIQGDLDDAIESFRRALTLDPGLTEIYLHLGDLLRRQGNFEEALEIRLRAVDLEPGLAQTHNNLGNAYSDLGRSSEAIAAYRKAITLNPGMAEAHLNLGILLHQCGAIEPAHSHYQTALSLNPDLADAHLNLGYALEQLGNPRGAIQCYRGALSIEPDRADAHFNLALQLLLTEDFAQGWEEYEWRWRVPELSGANPHSARHHWNGASLSGETILLYAEQGFGDAIQFVRYAPLVTRAGGNVVVQCPAGLKSLFGRMLGASAVVSHEEPVPGFDLCCSLLSLPRIFRTTLDRIPGSIPYLCADPEATRRWSTRLAADRAALKVGIVWASQTANPIAQSKSLRLDQFAPLAVLENVTFYSLQKGAAASEAAQPPQGLRVVDPSAELGDFSDTAALIANLDLVISVDTAVAHLAGAMGRRVWTLTHFPPDWRWMLGRDDSPWYPTMRLFRQKRARDWAPVVAQVAETLKVIAE